MPNKRFEVASLVAWNSIDCKASFVHTVAAVYGEPEVVGLQRVEEHVLVSRVCLGEDNCLFKSEVCVINVQVKTQGKSESHTSHSFSQRLSGHAKFSGYFCNV